jgi:hypothetical protein
VGWHKRLGIETVWNRNSTTPGAKHLSLSTFINPRFPALEKLPVVKEEVRVGKRAVQGTERVSDEVRREELRVDKDKKLDEEAEGTRKGKKPAA